MPKPNKRANHQIQIGRGAVSIMPRVSITNSLNPDVSRRYWYVSKDYVGTQTGSSDQPFNTIQAACDVVNPGESIRIRTSAAPYDATTTVTRSGSIAGQIIIEPDIGHTPILTYSGSGSGEAALFLQSVNYWTIQGLTFDGTGVYTSAMAVWVDGGNWYHSIAADQVGIQILNNTFLNWGRDAGGTDASYSDYTTVNIGGGYGPPNNNYLPNGTVVRGNVFDGSRHIALSMGSTKYSLVEDNEFVRLKCGTQNAGDGSRALVWTAIKVVSGTTGVGIGDVYRGNIFHDYDLVADLTQGVGGYTEMSAIHPDVGPAQGTIDDNVMYDIDASNVHVAAIMIFVEQDCHGWTVRRNTVANVGVSGVRHNPGSVGAVNQYLNNTFYNCGWRGMEFYSGQAIAKNNLSINGAISQVYTSANAVSQGNLTIDYNDYWDNVTGANVGQWNNGSVVSLASWKTASSQDAHAINADPLFTAPPTDLTLQAGSPAIGTGESGVNMGAL